MSTAYKPIPPITTLPFNGFPQPVTAISFDPVSDVLWTGLNSGTVTGYCGTQSIRGPSFRVGGNLGVKKIAAGDHYVRAVGDSSNGLGSWSKGGVNKWFYRYAPIFFVPSRNDMIGRPSNNTVTFSAAPSSQPVAVSLANLEMVFLSPATGALVRTVSTTSILTQLEHSHSMLLSGSSDGFVRVHDLRTGMGRAGGAENFVKAHARSIEGLKTSGDFVFTIGMGERRAWTK
jgi:PAB-dependent poly(A)-specific ribonuclease subunit 2